ncbi:autotransporter-associated beta strand repeat-containing protein [Planctomycetota bacterium]|nr:autotransporter-associated beta strand repeat-containing protein [Planctomycetota bacterium]
MKAPLQTSSLLPAAMALITIGTVFSTTSPASADTIRWDGSENSWWENSSNWQPSGVPDSSDTVVFSDSAPNTYVELNEDATIEKIEFEGNTNYTLANATSSGKQITISSGDITTTGSATHNIYNDLLLGSSAGWNIEADLQVHGNVNAGNNNTLNKNGSGTLTLTGGTDANPSSVGLLHVRNGHLILDGARMNVTDNTGSERAFAAYGGDITLKNGAVVQLTRSGLVDRNSTLTVTGSGTSLSGYFLDAGYNGEPTSGYINVRNGAALDFATVRIGFYNDGAMAVENGGTVRTNNLLIGVDEAALGKVFVRGNGSLIETKRLDLGGRGSDHSGGKGFLTVENDGLVRNTGITTLWIPSSSITINNGGTFETDQLIGEGTIYLSGDDAMTVGINNGDSTFDGQIQDAGGSVPGRLTKTGTGNFTLTGGTAENPMSFDILDSEGGEVILDGTHINLTGAGWYDQSPLIAEGGDITIQNGAVVRTDAEEGNMWVNGNTLTTTGSNTSLTGSRIDVTGGTGKLIVTDNAEVDLATTLYLGGYYGDGQMEVRGGGTLSSDVAYFADYSTAQVTGYNSRLLTQQMYVTGNSTLTVDDNGAVEVAEFIDLSSSANSSLTIDDGGSVRVNQIKGNGTISFAGDDALTVGINNGSSTFSGLIQDAGGDEPSKLTKVGSGTFTLTGGTEDATSTFDILDSEDGSVVLNGAHINLTSTGEDTQSALLATGGNIALQNGTVVQLDDEDGEALVRGNTLTLTGEDTSLSGYQMTVFENNDGSTGNLVIEDNAELDFTYLLVGYDVNNDTSGAGNLVMQSGARAELDGLFLFGTGTASLSNSQLFAENMTLGNTGTLNVNDGSEVEVADTIYMYSSGNSINVNGGTLQTDGLDGSGTVSISGTDALTVGINNGSSTFSGTIQDAAGGAGTLTQTGESTFTLTNANTYTGGTQLYGGTLQLSNNNAAGTGTITVQDTTTNRTLGFTDGVNVGNAVDMYSDLNMSVNDGESATYSGIITDYSDSFLTYNGGGTLTLTGGTADAPSNIGLLRIHDGNLIIDNAHINLTSTNQWEWTFDVSGGDVTLQNGAVVQTNEDPFKGSLVYIGGHTLTLTGSGTLLTSGWTRNNGRIVVEDNAALRIADLNIGDKGTGELAVQSGATVSVDKLRLGNGSTSLVTGSGSRLETGSLTLYESGPNTFTVEDGGVVEVAGHTYFGLSNSIQLIIDNGTFRTDQLSNYNYQGYIARPTISISGDNALTVGINNGSSTFDGQIQDAAGGAGSLTKTGSGTFTLTGDNTYTGNTFVTDGTLLASNTTGSATGSGDVAVFDGGTLGGNGMIASKVFINDGGTLAPGESAGHLTVNDVVFGIGSTFEVELGGLEASTEYDVLSVLSYAILDNGNGPLLDVSLIDGFELDFGQHFEIVNVGDRLIGGFNSLAEGARVSSFNDIDLFITYQAGDGNDIALYTAAIPEPASFVLLGLGGLALILRGGRRSAHLTQSA